MHIARRAQAKSPATWRLQKSELAPAPSRGLGIPGSPLEWNITLNGFRSQDAEYTMVLPPLANRRYRQRRATARWLPREWRRPSLLPMAIMLFVLTNPQTSRYFGGVVLFACSILLINLFEHLLEGIHYDIDSLPRVADETTS